MVTDERFAVKKSAPGTGRGLFARTLIRKGDFILEYTGRHIPNAEADALTTKYLFELDDTWTIDGSARSNTARYINHACNPNTEAEIDDGHVLIYACKDIEPGEEVTIDYGDEYFNEFIKPYGCQCASCARAQTAQNR